MASEKKDALAKTEETALTVPEFVKTGKASGTEHMTQEDFQVPRLLIAHAQSPQVTKGDPAKIEGLEVGQAFNDLTSEILGEDPIDVIFVRADPPRWVEFDPDDRKVVLDRNVPHGDPRTLWTTNKDGEAVKPAATKFYDYVVLTLPDLEPMALSYKSTGLNIARKLNGVLRSRYKTPGTAGPGVSIPIFARRFRLVPSQFKNDQGAWYLFVVQSAGIVQDAETYGIAEQAFDAVKLKTINFAREPGTDDAEGGSTEEEM